MTRRRMPRPKDLLKIRLDPMRLSVCLLIVLVVVLAVQWALSHPVNQLLESYDHRFALRGLELAAAAAVPLFSAVLGWLGAMLATARHLAEAHPE